MKVGIINRGEVAVRIFYACQELGFEPVLFHSTVDKKTKAYRLYKETIELLGESALDTYLNEDLILQKAKEHKVEALHPGFGFLSENPLFSKKCKEQGIVFVGPSYEAMEILSHKDKSKKHAVEWGLPVIPQVSFEEKEWEKKLGTMGFPVMMKSSVGGGGKGMKVLHSLEEVSEALILLKEQSQKFFGEGDIFFEKYLQKAKHIEVQVFCDPHEKQTKVLLHRECSLQRSYQKILEEAPCSAVDKKLMDVILKQAGLLLEKAHYEGAGTVEFLVEDGKHYFLEVNTRLQVEHTVTEMILSVDLVKAQLLIASGKNSNLPSVFEARGVALEARICAEVPPQFYPSTGKISFLHLPQGPHRRFDFGLEVGDEVTKNYDSMIGKVIVLGRDREDALKKLKTTLQETVIFGIETNIEFLISLTENKEVIEGKVGTLFLESFIPSWKPRSLNEEEEQEVENLKSFFVGSAVEEFTENPVENIWRDGWTNF